MLTSGLAHSFPESRGIVIDNSNYKNKHLYYICKIIRAEKKPVIGLVGLVDYKDLNTKILPHEQVKIEKVNEYEYQFHKEGILNNPILLFYKEFPELQNYISHLVNDLNPSNVHFIEGVIYEIYIISDMKIMTQLQRYIDIINKLYIADGHHRIHTLLKIYSKLTTKTNISYMSFMVQESDLDLSSFSRYLKGVEIVIPVLIARLNEHYLVKQVSESELNLEQNLYIYHDKNWYELHLKTKDNLEKHIQFASSNVDRFIISPLVSQYRFSQVLYIPNTYDVQEMEKACVQNQCELAIHIPKPSLDELYKMLEKSVIFPPHSTYFTPKIPNNLFIQKLRFSNL